MNQILKRDGRKVLFEPNKIEQAVLKAFIAVDGTINEYAKQKATNIATFIAEQAQKQELTVEQIQDMVEQGLMSTKRKDVARAYITYRNERNKARQLQTQSFQMYREKLHGQKIENQNANVDEQSFGGRMGEADAAQRREYAINYLLSPLAKENHLNNRIYIHDLDHYAAGDHNCLSIPFDKLLAKGFNTRQTDVRPASSINTAFQLVAVIFQLESLQQFGGVSATHLDWTMVPYVRKSFFKHFRDGVKYIDKRELDYSFQPYFPIDELDYEAYSPEAAQYAMDMTQKELDQAVEGLYHNLNTLQSRSGNQLPFTSINYGTCTLPEGRMVIRALLEGCKKGVGKFHRTSIFPCGIFQSSRKINRYPGTPNYDLYKLALECTAQRLYPNYANIDWSGNEGYDETDPKTYFSTMGK